MSVEYYLACHKCQQVLHVAQTGMSGFTFYRGEPDCMKQLGVFIEDHEGHPIQIVLEQGNEDETYAHIDWKTGIAAPHPADTP